MPIEQTKSNRKPSGGRLKNYRKSRQYALGSRATMTQVEEDQRAKVRTMGGGQKVRTAATTSISVTDPKTGKTKLETIENVTENPANRNFIRRNILTKGAIVQTKSGKVRVTSRPGQNGTVSGVKVE